MSGQLEQDSSVGETTLKDFLSKASRNVSDFSQSAKDAVTNKVEGGAHFVESKALGIRDSALDLGTSISGTTARIVLGVKGTVSVMVNVGIPVIAVVAPVPTLIGLGLLWLIHHQITESNATVDQLVADERDKRKLERVTLLLKKYGQIPETATLETDLIIMVIDSKNGDVSGRVLSGEYQDRELSTLSDDDVERLMKFAPDDDTKSIVEAYKALRMAKSMKPDKNDLAQSGV